MQVRFSLNGEVKTFDVRPQETLLEVLRREGHHEVKKGCDDGNCGVCTVIVDGRAVTSCLMLAGQVHERSVETVTALGTLQHPHLIQKLLVEKGAVQCGYCTPGIIMSAEALLRQNPRPSTDEICESLDGNLCRCTGYVKIVEAIEDAAHQMLQGTQGAKNETR